MILRLLQAFNPMPPSTSGYRDSLSDTAAGNLQPISGWAVQTQPSQSAGNDTGAPHNPAWSQALQSHLQHCARPATRWSLPKAFAGFGRAHAAVGELLWFERAHMPSRLIHVHGSQGNLLAVVNPRSHQVLIKRSVPSTPSTPPALWGALSWRALPSAATSLEGMSRDAFDRCTVDELLWFCGQTQGFAAQSLPVSISTSPLCIRRFPSVAPACLELRHFTLIQLLAQGPRSFEQLLDAIDDEDSASLCGDIASLVMCRALTPALTPAPISTGS